MDCASGVLGPLGERRVRVFRLANNNTTGSGGKGATSPSPPWTQDAFCVTALALPLDTPLPEAASAALTGRLVGGVDVLLPVSLAEGLLEGGPPPEEAALATVVEAAAAVPSSDAAGRLLRAFATLLASKGLADDLGASLAAAGEVEAARRKRGGGGASASAAAPTTTAAPTPPTPTPAQGTAAAVQEEEGENPETADLAGSTPPITTAVPAFAARVALFEAGGV